VSSAQGTLSRAPRPSSLADVLDLILDKGLVIDAYVRVSVVGIEILTIDARVVIASVDTYLHFAEAVNRLDLPQTETKGLTGLFGSDSEDGKADDEEQDDDATEDPDEGTGDRALASGAGSGSREEDGGGRRRPAGALARKLADRGKWDDP
jgi:hypothetical protein